MHDVGSFPFKNACLFLKCKADVHEHISCTWMSSSSPFDTSTAKDTRANHKPCFFCNRVHLHCTKSSCKWMSQLVGLITSRTCNLHSRAEGTWRRDAKECSLCHLCPKCRRPQTFDQERLDFLTANWKVRKFGGIWGTPLAAEAKVPARMWPSLVHFVSQQILVKSHLRLSMSLRQWHWKCQHEIDHDPSFWNPKMSAAWTLVLQNMPVASHVESWKLHSALDRLLRLWCRGWIRHDQCKAELVLKFLVVQEGCTTRNCQLMGCGQLLIPNKHVNCIFFVGGDRIAYFYAVQNSCHPRNTFDKSCFAKKLLIFLLVQIKVHLVALCLPLMAFVIWHLM